MHCDYCLKTVQIVRQKRCLFALNLALWYIVFLIALAAYLGLPVYWSINWRSCSSREITLHGSSLHHFDTGDKGSHVIIIYSSYWVPHKCTRLLCCNRQILIFKHIIFRTYVCLVSHNFQWLNNYVRPSSLSRGSGYCHIGMCRCEGYGFQAV